MQYHHRDGSNPSHPAGDSRKLPLRVDFDRRLKLEFLGSKITSDAGLLAYRELDDVLGLTDLAGAALSDLRRGKNTRHLLTGLLRQSVFGRLAGYELKHCANVLHEIELLVRGRRPEILPVVGQIVLFLFAGLCQSKCA